MTELSPAVELASLAKRKHYFCEDSWYSCPKAERGCTNDAEGDECTCGADAHNAKVNELLAAALAKAEPEGPTDDELNALWNCCGIADEYGHHQGNFFDFARAVLARWGNRQEMLDSSPADGEVAELVSWLRATAEALHRGRIRTPWLTRAADLLERMAPHERARAALAKPEPDDREPGSVSGQLSDQGLLDLAAKAIDGYTSCGIAVGEYEEETYRAIEVYGSELIAFARAVLARSGK